MDLVRGLLVFGWRGIRTEQRAARRVKDAK